MSPSVSSPSKYFEGRTGDTEAITPLTTVVWLGDVISLGERGTGGVASLTFLGGVCISRLRERLAI